MNGSHFQVEQLLSISAVRGDNGAQNVQLLKQLIPLSLISRGLYRSFHFHESAGSSFINPLNYYIITPHYLILLKQDQSVAYIQQNEALIAVYAEHFRTLIERCNPLVSYGQNIAELFDMANTTIDSDGYLYMMSQPCFGRYYTPEIIGRYFQVQNCPIPGMFDAAVQHFAMLHKVKKNFCTVFSEKGLQYFIETGIVTEMPPEYIPPAEIADRIYLLSSLRKDIAEGTVTGLIARPSYLKMPDFLSMSIDSHGNTHFDTTSAFPGGAFYCNIHISEKSICQAFKDFFHSLPGSRMVYSQEDTLRMLDEGIHRLSDKNPPQG